MLLKSTKFWKDFKSAAFLLGMKRTKGFFSSDVSNCRVSRSTVT